jgi:PAS domain S-box-containing protein
MKSSFQTSTYKEKGQFSGKPQPILLGLFCFIALGLVIGGIGFYNQQDQTIRQRKYKELQSITMLKVDQILQWRQERLTDAKMNSTSPFFVQGIDDWLNSPGDPKLKAQLSARLQMIVEQEGYQNVILAMPTGQLLYSVTNDVTEIDQVTRDMVVQAANSPSPIFGNLFRDTVSDKVYLDVAAPIYDNSPTPIAVLIFRIDPEIYLYPLIQSWPVPSQSAETLLVEKDENDAVYLNTLRFRNDPPMTIRVPLTRNDIPAVQAGMGQTGDLQGVDYRGIDVLAEIQPVPETQWFLEAKVDTAEILAEINSLGMAVVSFVFLSIVMTAILAAYSFHYRQRVLYRELYQNERALRESQEETRITLYSIGDGVITTDSEGCITRINPVAEKLTGWIEKDAIGKPLAQVFRIINEITRKEVVNPVERALHEGLVIGLANHTILISQDGTERPIADSGAPIRNSQGDIMGVVLVFRDQTQERVAQRENALLNYTISTSLNEIYLFDDKTLNFLFVNDGALKNLGYSLEQMLRMTPIDLKPEFTPETFQQFIRSLKDHREPVLVFETIHKRKDGTLYPVEIHLQLFEYEQEQVFLAMINDITERKKIEQQVLREKEKVQKYLDISAVMMVAIDANESISMINKKGLEVLGYEDEGLIGENWFDICIPQDQREEVRNVFKEIVAGKITKFEYFENSILTKTGKERTIGWHNTILLDENGKYSITLSSGEDITERKRMEQALYESEERYRRLFENDHVVMLLIDPEDGCIVDANPAACTFYGWSKDELVQLNINQINILTAEEIQKKMSLAKDEKQRVFTLQHRKKNGVISDVEVFSGPIQLNGNTLLYSVVNDITERKNAEKLVIDQLQELRRWYKAMLGRESRIMELKQEVNDLLFQMNQPPRYPSIQEKAENE